MKKLFKDLKIGDLVFVKNEYSVTGDLYPVSRVKDLGNGKIELAYKYGPEKFLNRKVIVPGNSRKAKDEILPKLSIIIPC